MEEQKRNPAAGLSESEQVQVRRQKLADLQAAGNDPFTLTKFPQDAYSADLKEEFKELPNETDSGKLVALAGRMMSKRVMGKASFAHLRDDKGDIQLYVRRDELGDEAYAAFKKLDVGDIIGVKGEVFRTKTGELSVRATELTLLAKSLRPLPEKFHGLTDTEMRYRQRYVDLIANPEVKDTFIKRSRILKEIRAYLDEKGFLEVDTPILTPFEIGASARPFYTHHNTLNMDMVLRIETELYLKRLIVGGMDRVYEVGRIFRNEGMDPKHNPEFTTIELYQAFTDFHGMMDLVEELYKRLALKICGSLVIPYQGKQIDMSHWERLTMVEAVKKYSGVDFNDWKTDEDAIAAAKEHHVELPEVPTKGAILAEFFDAFVEDKLIQPTFVVDHPLEISPLAKKHPENPELTQRFELFILGHEYGNAFTELNDPVDQAERFRAQVAAKDMGDDEAMGFDADYIRALEYGMPPAGGVGIGIDRLVMLLTDAPSIRDVLLFPHMKPEKGFQSGAAAAKAAEAGNAASPFVKSLKPTLDYSKIAVEPLFEEFVDFDTFSKSDFRAVKVKACEAVKKSKKLLNFTLDDGTGTDRTILSGIHAYYEPEDLVGKTLLAITNLPPRKMMGIPSCGMLISAIHEEDGEERLNLIQLDASIPAGAKMY